MIALSLSLIVVALALSLPLTWVCRSAAGRLGQLDQPGHRKIHDRPIPVTGGIAIFWATAVPMLAALAAAWWLPTSLWESLAPAAVEHLPGVRQQTGMGLTLVGCLAGLHLVGVIDDRASLGPFLKLFVQIIAAAALAVFFDVRLLTLLGGPVSIVVTVFWFVTITNAFNFLDNMDGLSGGVATICSAILLACALLSGQWFIAAVAALLIGALLGFLWFNFPPASIFMGDGGSLVVGFLVAFCAVRVTYTNLDASAAHWWAVLTPLVVLAIPLYDLTSVTLIRISQGRSPFVGDTQHFSHRLVQRGLTRPAAVIVIYACTLATGLSGVLLTQVAHAWQAALIAGQTLAVLVLLALLERGTNQRGAA
jgi:UDP-GlcNAc:undecaprenyl-phosphate GlcNAc-1-phosphate transferase